MTLQETFFEIWLVIACINVAFFFTGQVLTAAGISNLPLVTPFTNQNFLPPTPPSLYNATYPNGTFVQNMTNHIYNTTDSNPVNLAFNSVFWPLAAIWTFVQFITGGFLFSAIILIGFPPSFVYGLMSIMGALLGRSLLYYATGR